MGMVILSPSHGADKRLAWGTHTTVAADDLLPVPELATVEQVTVTLLDDPVAGCQRATAVPNANGTINIKTWKATGTADTALIAATTFGKRVSWIAVGS